MRSGGPPCSPAVGRRSVAPQVAPCDVCWPFQGSPASGRLRHLPSVDPSLPFCSEHRPHWPGARTVITNSAEFAPTSIYPGRSRRRVHAMQHCMGPSTTGRLLSDDTQVLDPGFQMSHICKIVPRRMSRRRSARIVVTYILLCIAWEVALVKRQT